jgi:hypothetical protein
MNNELQQSIKRHMTRFGVNIKDENDRTPIHSVFRSSTTIANVQGQLRIETDFGNQVSLRI